VSVLSRNFSLCALAVATLFINFDRAFGLDKSVTQATKEAAELLPSTTVAYAEATHNKQLIATLFDHPLRERIEALDDVQKAYKSKDMKQLNGAVILYEAHVEISWREALEKLTGNGLYFAVDAETEGVAMLAHSSDEALLTKTIDLITQFAELDAKTNKKPEPFKKHEYRDFTAYEFKDQRGGFVQLGPWLLVCNKQELAKQIADNFLDKKDETLAHNKAFRTAQTAGKDSTVWGYANIEALRNSDKLNDLMKEQSDNPIVELVLGGALDVLRDSPHVTATIDLTKDNLTVAVATPYKKDWVGQPRQFYFGADGKGEMPQPLTPKQTVFSLQAHRDIGEFWLAKEDLFEERIAAEMEKADSSLSTFFAGLDFGEEVLGAAKPQWQIVASRQDFSKIETPEPEIRLPAFAVIANLKEPEKMQQRLKVAFQSAIGITNYGLGQQGQPQFDVETQRIGDKETGEARLVSASYVPQKDSEEGLIAYNFSPTIAFADERFVLASTRELGVELATLALKTPLKTAPVNIQASAQADVVNQLLKDNRDQLIAQNQLEEGHDRKAATKEIETLFQLVDALKTADIQLKQLGEAVELRANVTFAK